MQENNLLQKRIKRIDDAIRFKKPDTVPNVSHFYAWMVSDYGSKLNPALRDWDLSEKIYRKFLEDYNFDCSVSYLGLLCHPYGATDILGQGAYIIDEENGCISLKDFTLLTVDEYHEFIKDPDRYTWNTLLPKKYAKFKNLTVADYKKIIDMFLTWADKLGEHTNIAFNEYQVPLMNDFDAGFPGIEMLFCFLSGMKETSLAMRRNPKAVEEICAMYDSALDNALSKVKKENCTGNAAFGLHQVMLAHNFLNIKQWEKYYWPWLKKVCDKVVEENLTYNLFTEGKIVRFADYFKDYPKGHLAIHVEEDDIYELAKALPNCCAMGGLTTETLGKGTKEDCINQAKKLIDDLGSEGGLILSENKMMSYKRDAKSENVKAVCDFVAGYNL